MNGSGISRTASPASAQWEQQPRSSESVKDHRGARPVVAVGRDLVRELAQAQRMLNASVVDYLWLAGVLNRAQPVLKRMETSNPDPRDLREDLQALASEFKKVPTINVTELKKAEQSVEATNDRISARDGPIYTRMDEARLTSFYEDLRFDFGQAVGEMHKALAQLEHGAKDALSDLSECVTKMTATIDLPTEPRDRTLAAKPASGSVQASGQSLKETAPTVASQKRRFEVPEAKTVPLGMRSKKARRVLAQRTSGPRLRG